MLTCCPIKLQPVRDGGSSRRPQPRAESHRSSLGQNRGVNPRILRANDRCRRGRRRNFLVRRRFRFSKRNVDLTRYGGINTQTTLPHGTPEQVRAEVRDRVRVLGKGGGYICSSGHAILPDVPFENVLAMIDEARKTRP